MKNESELKGKIVKKIREEGGYGRRIEDQYAVGLPDMLLVPRNGPVFMVEAKIIRGNTFHASPRQGVELDRIAKAGGLHFIPALLGWKGDTIYMEIPSSATLPTGIVWTHAWDITAMLREYLHYYKGQQNAN